MHAPIIMWAVVALTASAHAFPKPSDRLYTAPVSAPVNFSLSKVFGDHAVLQRDRPSTVWGFAPAGTTVKTAFQGKTYTSTAGADTVWRQALPAQPATKTPQTISFSASTGEVATLNDVLFGDVYVCGGQSNMQFSIPGTTNATEEAAAANAYPDIRLFTVGQGTSSKTPLNDLMTIEQTWAVANATSVSGGGNFGHFSSVCWFFGKGIHDGLGGAVPLG